MIFNYRTLNRATVKFTDRTSVLFKVQFGVQLYYLFISQFTLGLHADEQLLKEVKNNITCKLRNLI